MSSEMPNTSDKIFYQIYNQEFRRRVPEGTPEALPRKLEKGPNAGKEVYEVSTKALFGIIENIELEDGDYGKQIKITLDENDDGKHPVISVGAESKNGRDLMKRLPRVDFSKEVRIMPYQFTPEGETDERSGISLTQKDEEGKYTVKVENYFFNPETKKFINGYPSIDWDNTNEAKQKIYKIQRDEFLLNYLKENVIPKFNGVSHVKESSYDYPESDPFAEESPF